jgi:hypothetical protein
MKAITLFLSLLLFSSCWKHDAPTKARLLPSSGAVERVPVYDSVNQWSVAQKQFVKVWGIARYSNQPVKEYEVVPNGQQVMKYAVKTGYNHQVAIGIIMIVAVIVAGIWFSGYHTVGFVKLFTRGAALLVAIAIGLLTLRPAKIARNNAKTITEKQLQYYEAQDPELGTFWDSIFVNNKLQK